MTFAILEVGSTNTKGYLYQDGNLIDLGLKYIPFKNNYNEHHKILESDIKELYEFINKVKQYTNNIYLYGTSIFRNISEQEKNEFIEKMKDDMDVTFKVVSADEENEYTVKGVINNIDYNKKMAVVIGGGGSTEIAVIENKKIIKKINLKFGAMDITDHFPELKTDIVNTDFDNILNYTKELVGDLGEEADLLVLAGGDYIRFYQIAGYEMSANFIYEDINQPYLLAFDKMEEYDKDIMTKSLDEIKQSDKDNANWWDGARGMRFCMNAVAKSLDSKYIIPTKINMIIGIADEIIQS